MRTETVKQKPQLLIIGMDGGTFDLIEPWVKGGRLPNIGRLMREGSYGDLISTVPPVTPPAWTTFMTGKNPGKHGLFDFLEPRPGGYEMQYANGRTRKAKSLWRILNEAGLTVGVINVPMTYPPEPVDGYLISGMDTPDEQSDFTYPPSLKPELIDAVGGLPIDIRHLGHMRTDEVRDETLRALEALEEQRTRVALYLMERYPTDLMMVVFNASDQVQHHFWHYADPAHPQYDPEGAKRYGDAIFRIYRKIDDCIGRLLSAVGSETAVMMVSDHGGGAVGENYIYLNRYLARLGLLKTVRRRSRVLNPSEWFSVALRLADRFFRGMLTPSQKLRLATIFPRLRERVETYLSFGGIEWAGTKAYAFENAAVAPNVWINLKGRRPNGTVEAGSEYEELIRFIRTKLLELTDPATGRALIKNVYRASEVYHGPYTENAPDLILDWWSDNHLVAKPSFPCREDDPVVARRGSRLAGGVEWSGTHRINGMMLFRGPGFLGGGRTSGPAIMDMAPTILCRLGVPIPEDMDGKPIESVFEPSYRAAHPVVYQKAASEPGVPVEAGNYSADEAEKIRQRLAGLGYLE